MSIYIFFFVCVTGLQKFHCLGGTEASDYEKPIFPPYCVWVISPKVIVWLICNIPEIPYGLCVQHCLIIFPLSSPHCKIDSARHISALKWYIILLCILGHICGPQSSTSSFSGYPDAAAHEPEGWNRVPNSSHVSSLSSTCKNFFFNYYTYICI